MSTIKSIGSIWVIAATLLLNTIDKHKYFVYLGKDGQIYTVEDENEAPDGTNYVVTVTPGTDPVFVAARLAYVAISQ